MARGRSGVISKEYKGEDNTAYHDVIKLFKIYRVVNWQMQIKISQVKEDSIWSMAQMWMNS